MVKIRVSAADLKAGIVFERNMYKFSWDANENTYKIAGVNENGIQVVRHYDKFKAARRSLEIILNRTL